MIAMVSVIVFFVGLAMVDVIIIWRKGIKASISATLIRRSYKYPMIPFLIGMIVGFVCGHLFWRMNTLDIYECDAPYVQNIVNNCFIQSDSQLPELFEVE